jgi:hypothetical protein
MTTIILITLKYRYYGLSKTNKFISIDLLFLFFVIHRTYRINQRQ